MIIFPAIDVLDNRAVRLLYGKRESVTDYGTPESRAVLWRESGAEYLHLVDLNGAFDNSRVNDKTLKNVIREVGIPVQIGGGIKSFDRVKYYIEEVGATRVIIGSALVTDRQMAEKAYQEFGDKIVAGIDALDGKVRIKGWVENVDITPIKLAEQMKELGATTVVYTDISRDGALTGLNIDSTALMQEKTGLNIIASGGAACIDELDKLNSRGIYGAILGRSIYEGSIDLKDAINKFK